MIQEIWIPKLTDVLPPNISADSKMYAAAAALDMELKALSNEAWQVLHVPRLEKLNHDVLDHLAWQFHVDHYEPSTMPLEVKQNLIRQSIAWHKIKGTPASVENFLGAFGIKAEVEEWYTYDGAPYFFRLKLSDVAYMGDDGETFMRLVYAAKNERSWLDKFIFDLTREPPDIKIHIGQPTIISHREYYAINNRREEKTTLSVAMPTSYTGNEKYSYNGQAARRDETSIRYAIITRIGGKEQYKAAQPIEPEYDWEFEKLLWERWRNWKHNPLVKQYSHHFEDDGEIEPDDPEELFPAGNFLRIYFKFPYTQKLRYLTLTEPREGIEGAAINALGLFSAANGILLNGRRQPTTGITRALYVTKTTQKIL